MNALQRRAAAAALAVAIAAPAEGLRNWAYRDPVGIPTICFGYTRGVQMGDYKDTAECRGLLTSEMLAAVDQVERCVPGLPAQVLAAFADAVYNLGPTIACSVSQSTAARMLRAGDLVGACNQLPRWNKARVAGLLVELPGLTKRRGIARDTCLQGAA
ncbi:lysozyme [Pigmentiphaga daeguensis]